MKVGEYIRTNKGYIARIKKITELTIICDGIIYPTKNYGFDKQLNKESLKRLKVKSSPNIIDLIEVGDICTFEVVDIDNYEDYIGKHTEVINQDELEDFKDMIQNESAKLISIVTKEQFESMEYKVEE